jgi:hypothetical protein
MRKTLVTATLVGTLGLGVGAVLSPGLASAATGGGTAVSGRLTAIQDALKGLVSDKTLTQEQADKVATTLDQKLPQGHHGGGPGGPGHGAHVGPKELATILGITPQELRTALEAGKTPAQIAAGKGMRKADLISTLVAAEKAELAQAVKDGRLTQARADTISKDLAARVTAQVDRSRLGREHDGPPPTDTSSTDTSPSSADGGAQLQNA